METTEPDKNESKHAKHNKKRRIIGVSLYHKDQQIMKNKFGKILSATEAKQALLYDECLIITKKIDPEISKTVIELKRIGNNLNQLTFLANAQKNIPAELVLLEQLKEIKEAIKHVRGL